MLGCFILLLGCLTAQCLSLTIAIRNYRYALSEWNKYQREKNRKTVFHPSVALIIPCKGLDQDFEQNIRSFYELDYDHYDLFFVVDNRDDPAHAKLQSLQQQLEPQSKTRKVHLLVAGSAQTNSQKLHNLLHGCEHIDPETEVMVFADSDICVRHDWLSSLIWPLRKSWNGAATGYRWFIPIKNSLPSLALSAVNAKIAQLLGNSRYCQAWGGSMAIRTQTFHRIGLKALWSTALSDDYVLSYAVKKTGLKVVYVPVCLVASYLSTSWTSLFEFMRRQFLITRISATGTWTFGLISSILSLIGPWGALALTLTAAVKETQAQWLGAMAITTFLFFGAQCLQAVLRQKMTARLLPDKVEQMRWSKWADITCFWLWSFLMLTAILASTFGNTICWRGIRYRLLGPTKLVILEQGAK